MYFRPVKDLDRVFRILTSPAIYTQMGDDFLPLPHEFKVNDHPGIVYLEACTEVRCVGLFCLFPQNRICWEIHAAMLPRSGTREKWEAAKELVPWLARHTSCMRLTASIPSCNRPAIIYGTHGIGMRYVGRQERAFLKSGELQDLVILGRSVCPVS